MKSHAKHQTSTVTSRPAVAALVVGGLVAGTVATAGAVTLRAPQGTEAAQSLTGDLAGAAERDASQDEAADAATVLTSLRSSSLDELREQGAAGRSEERTAPEAQAAPEDSEVETVLADAGFTGRTVEQPQPEPVATQSVETAQADDTAAAAQQSEQTAQESQAAAPQEAQQTQQQEPAQTQQAQPAAAPAPASGGVLGVAASYVGYPYVLGGTPPSAFDCSGFTWWVFQQAGISIPRTVAGQRGAVTPVSNPQPGDLVIYNDWHHVGIYAGGGMTYEALNPGTGVRYGPILSSNVWYGRLG